MFKRTSQQKSVKGVKPIQKKTSNLKATNLRKFIDSTDTNINISGGNLNVERLIIGRNQEVKINKVVNLTSDTEENHFNLEFTGTSLTINNLVKSSGNSDSSDIEYCDITVKGGKKTVSGTETSYGTHDNPVVLMLPGAFNNKTKDTVVNWNLYDSGTGDSVSLPTSGDDKTATGTYVKIYATSELQNDSITIINSATTPVSSKFVSGDTDFSKALIYLQLNYLTYYRRDCYKDDNDEDVYVQINVGSEDITGTDNKKYTVSAIKINSDGTTGSNYEGAIYYPFRGNLSEEAEDYVIASGDSIVFSNPVIFGYTDAIANKEIGIVADQAPTDGKPIQVLGKIIYNNSDEYPIEYRYPVTFGSEESGKESVGVLPTDTATPPTKLSAIRYNMNSIQKVNEDNTTTPPTYSTEEVPADKWIIDKACTFHSNLKYKNNSSSITSTVEENDGETVTYSGYVFGEPILEIEDSGSLISKPESGNSRKLGSSTTYDINLVGVDVTLKSNTDNTKNATIECNTLTV